MDATSRYAAGLLFVLAAGLGLYGLLDDTPITCHVPNHFTSYSALFARKACWNGFLYRLVTEDTTESPPPPISNVFKKLPFFFLLQGVTFCLPPLLWSLVKTHPLVPVSYLTSAAKHVATCDTMSSLLGAHFLQHLLRVRSNRRIKMLTVGNCYLTISDVLVKMIDLTVAILNLMLILQLVGASTVLSYINIWNTDPQLSEHFPNEVMCDHKLVRLGNMQRYTHQCILERNAFNVALLSALACCYVGIAFVQVVRFLRSINFLVFVPFHDVKCALMTTHKESEIDEIQQLLGRDGVLLVQLVERESSAAVAVAMVTATSAQYQETHKM